MIAFGVRPDLGVRSGASHELELIPLVHGEDTVGGLEVEGRFVLFEKLAGSRTQAKDAGVVDVRPLHEAPCATADQGKEFSVGGCHRSSLITLDGQDGPGRQALKLIEAGGGAVGDRLDHSPHPLLRRQQAGFIPCRRPRLRRQRYRWALVFASLPRHRAPHSVCDREPT
ncbi:MULTISPECIES: hypothetical protein [unclassified Streptomyces]|uniref:hypothetical protein n=1 Tax=unclassified Streptomyces TaxID=2593676 RepID=UPI0035DA1513